MPDGIGAGLEKTFSRLAAEFDNFEAIIKTGFDDLGNISKAEKSFGKISNLVNQLSVQASSLTGVDPKKLIPQESLDRLKGLEKAWADVRKESEKKTNLDKEIEKQTAEIEEQEKALKKLTDQYDKLAAKNKALGSQKGALINSKSAKESRRNEVLTQMTALEGQKGGKSSVEYKALNQEYTQLSQSIRGLETDIRNIDKEINNNKVEMAGLNTQINSSTEAYEKMRTQLTNLKNTQITPKGLVELRTEIAKLTGLNINDVPTDLEELQRVINSLTEKQLEEVAKSLAEIKTNGDVLPGALNPAKESVKGLGEAGREVTRTANEIENLKKQVLQFFSLTNSVQLFKRAITSALNTVKELDATMTEAAVVTEFDVGDMWEKLPEYSKNAQVLGVSINGMYQATTLYYQQGLKSNEAMELGIETMKMAKIAGMESAEATEAMTAALRGFNMELSEASATKVNDVYSQLAAVTAADTEQIATAMEKTASIAASANMEFETTAALLAQIIETTQEAPETAGTAMKTIIARFAEVKSLREQGLVSGEDDEGEVIDVNKIQTALRTVGISMEGFFSGTEGLDSVLLKLAEKWGSLDFETQRYIATMAAGSRQQSRFIAMMSDYGRTTELVGQAQNSAGASQKQFEKTQDSLATSLTRLKNAWDEFLMGLANNEILKAGVDGLTKILETINKITEGLSGGNGLIKSIVSLAGVLATLKGGKALLGGTAIGGAMGGIVKKFTGGGEDVNKKASYFALPEGVQTGTTLKEKLRGGYQAKRNQIKTQRDNQPKGVKKYASKIQVGEDELKHRIRESAKSASSPQEAAEFSAIDKQLKKGMITADEAAKKYEALGGKITKTSLDFDAMGQAANTAGMAMMAAGAATSLLASAFESWGMEEEAEAMQTLSGVLMTLGPILMGIGSFLPTLTTLTAAQAAATWAALWPVLLIVAALGALVAIIVLVAKAAHDNSIEGRMEAAAKATERAKEAVEGARQAYDDLLSDKSGYDELQNKLDELTKGTLEWKQALAESNAYVLELLDKYPELAKYLTRGEHGKLEYTEEGWNIVQERQAQAVKNSQSALIASQMEETRLKQEKNEDDLEKAAKTAGIYKKKANTYVINTGEYAGTHTIETNEDTNQVDEKDLNAIYQKYKESGDDLFKLDADGSYSQALEDFAKSIGQTAEEIYNMKDAIAEYDQALVNNEATLQAQSEALLSSQVSQETLGHEFGDELISGMAAGFAANQEDREDEIYEKVWKEDGKTDAKDNEYFQQLMKENDLTAKDMTNDDAHNLEVLYAKMAGITREEIGDDLKGDKEALAAEIAKMQAAKEAGAQTDQIMKNMSKLDRNTQQDYAVLMSKDISNATNQFAEGATIDLAKMQSDLGLSEEEMLKAFGYDSKEAMETAFKEIANNATKEFEKITNKANNLGIATDKNFLDNATVKQLKSYTDLMTLSLSTGGKESLEKGFDKIFEEATTEQKEKILSVMETFDWTKEGAGEEFIAMLKEIAPNIDLAGESFEGFISNLKKVNAIYREFNLSDILNNAKAGFEEAEKIAGQKELTMEQYEKFVKDGTITDETEWFWNGKGWVNVTNGMDNLVEALKNNTIATLNSTKEEAQAQIDFYNSSNKEIEDYFKNEIKPLVGLNAADVLNQAAINNVSGAQKQALYAGSADEKLWSKFFNTKDDYDRWIALKAGGIDNAKRTVKTIDAFNTTGITIGDMTEDFDKYYSIYEQLAGLARKREQLEKRRNKLLEDGNAKLAKEERAQMIKSFNNEKEKQAALSNEKAKDMNSLKNQINALSSGIKLNIDENGVITLNESAVNNLDSSKREKFDDLIKQLESARDEKVEADNAILDLEISIDDLEDEQRSEYIEAANKIKEALIQERQEQIDKLKEINSSINDTNSKILSAMQDQLADARQARDNAKTEEELADKQRRLAYLQQDASGANAMEIMKLQKEIEEGQESYTDQLIDQKISELQKQNDQAAEQRERQIEILEAQKALWEQGAIWQDVNNQLNDLFTANGNFNENAQIVQLLKKTGGYDSMSKQEQEAFLEEIKMTLSSAYGVKFATGGLADFTGPAWLDGTKSRPEYVLNAGQTEAFFSLVDVLESLRFGSTKTTQNNGDSTFDIDINIEKIENDYDVEQMAEKIKTLIVDSSRYRNNNTL